MIMRGAPILRLVRVSVLLALTGCALSHERTPARPTDPVSPTDPTRPDPVVEPVSCDVTAGGRAVFSSDNDWFRPGPGDRGDFEATLRILLFLEEGLEAPRILVCGSRAELDGRDEMWADLDARERTFTFEAGCAGRLAELAPPFDLVMIDYVTSTGPPWDLPEPAYTTEDADALWAHFGAGGRLIVIAEHAGVFPIRERFGIEADFGISWPCDETFDVYDGDRRIADARVIAGPI